MTRSLQFRLSVFLSLAIVFAALAAGAFSFRAAYREANELQDDLLRQVATLMDRQRLSPAPLAKPGQKKDSDEASDLIVQTLGGATKADDLPLEAGLLDGLHDVTLGGKNFRVLAHTTAAGGRIAVAQDGAFRDQTAREAARHALAPFAILLPALLLLVAWIARGLVRPIRALAQDVDGRYPHDLRPVAEERAPAEIAPFVAAINRLLVRLASTLEAQRRFVADAAHELRSPMTALSLQAEALHAADMPQASREKLNELQHGISRGRNLLDQLLALARAQSGAERLSASVSVQGVFRQVLEMLLPLAEAKGIDIGVEGDQDAKVSADATELTILVRNLIDNAIRYTPQGGQVDLSVEQRENQVTVSVRDTGPGIPPDERARVFDPFYRLLGGEETGSGLGLSIVRTIAERMGGSVVLRDGDQFALRGLCVMVILPAVGGNGER